MSPRETNRGVKQAPFIVLTDASMPAALSEISFINNPSDESLLLVESGDARRGAKATRDLQMAALLRQLPLRHK